MQKIILITGTRKGLGKELSEYFLKQGHLVFGCSRGSSSIIHNNYSHYEVDVTDETGVIKMVRDVAKKHKRIDVLINNAGIASMNHVLVTPLNTIKKIFDTNYFGTFLFIREVSKIMIRNKNGRIINLTTVATPLRLEGEMAYASSKAAVESLTEICSKELAEFNITVNAVGPTPIPTDLIKSVPAVKMEALLQKQGIKRYGEFSDLVNVIKFFMDEKSSFITGQIIYLGGVIK